MAQNQNPSHGTFAVVGVTGQQGSSTARAQGVELVQADIDRPESLVEAFSGSEAVLAMTTFAGPDGPDGEVVRGMSIGDAARAAGLPRVVYSSVGGAERHTGIPHFESKRAVEEHLDSLGLHTTYLRPAFFMDNFASFSKPSIEDGTLVLRLPLPAGIPLQMVATRDIGRIGAVSLTAPDHIPTGALEIAGDELTGEQIAEAFGQAEGLSARCEPVPLEALAGDSYLQSMFGWFAQTPAYQADVELTRDLADGAWDLSTWLAHR